MCRSLFSYDVNVPRQFQYLKHASFSQETAGGTRSVPATLNRPLAVYLQVVYRFRYVERSLASQDLAAIVARPSITSPIRGVAVGNRPVAANPANFAREGYRCQDESTVKTRTRVRRRCMLDGRLESKHAPPTQSNGVDVQFKRTAPTNPRVGGGHDWMLQRDSVEKDAPPTPRRWTCGLFSVESPPSYWPSGWWRLTAPTLGSMTSASSRADFSSLGETRLRAENDPRQNRRLRKSNLSTLQLLTRSPYRT